MLELHRLKEATSTLYHLTMLTIIPDPTSYHCQPSQQSSRYSSHHTSAVRNSSRSALLGRRRC